MTRFERDNLKVRIIRLADLKSTGSPAELAAKLDVSVRSIKRFIRQIRENGQYIRYCFIRKTYVTEKINR
jgi:hypothetical protein